MNRRSFLGASAAALFAKSKIARATTQQLYLGQGASGGGGFVVDAADFDGTNDFLTRTSAFTNSPAATKTGSLSLWFKFDTLPTPGSGNIVGVIHGWGTAGAPPEGLVIEINDDGSLFFYAGEDDLGTDAAQCTFLSAASLVVVGSWHHLAIAWDASASLCKAYYDGAAISFGTSPTFNNFNFNWTRVVNWTYGAQIGGSGKSDGGMAEVWVGPNQYIDFSVAANLQKFRTAGGKPVDVGADGSTPTGTKPLFYQHLADAEAAANFATNRTANGNWTVTGALTTYASSPSD